MSSQLDQRLNEWFDEVAPRELPTTILPHAIGAASRIRQQRAPWYRFVARLESAWNARSSVAPSVVLGVVTAIVLAALLAVAVGSRLIATPRLADVPYLTRFCDLASLDEVRTILGDDAATIARGLGRSNHTGMDSCVWRSEVPHERFLGVWDMAPSDYEYEKIHPTSWVESGQLTPVADLGDDAFVVTGPSEAELFVKKGVRATNVFYRPVDTESTAQMQQIVTEMGTLVAERISGAPSAHGDLCQLLTADDVQTALQWTDVGAVSFVTHCEWGGTNPSDSTGGYLRIYDVPVVDFDAANALGGDPVPGMADEAFILTKDSEPTLYVRKGDRAVAISTPHVNTRLATDPIPPYGPEDELKIGTIVAERLAAAASGTFPPPAQSVVPSSPVTWVSVEPDAVVDVPNASGVIGLATDGSTVWAAGQGELLRIDGASGRVDHLPAPVATDDTSLLWADDGLWVARWNPGKVYRLDPTTGAIELAIDLPYAVNPQLVGTDLWVGRDDRGEMVKVDRATGALGTSISQGAHGLSSQGAMWFSGGTDPPMVIRVDPASGATVVTIQVPPGTGCGVGALTGETTFPGDWLFTSGCRAATAETRPFTRIDPRTNTVVGTIELPATYGADPVSAGAETWFAGSFLGADGAQNGGIVLLDPLEGYTGQAWFSLPGVVPDGGLGVGRSIWIPDRAGHRVLRYDLDSLQDAGNGVQF
jgi:hypothetical protein